VTADDLATRLTEAATQAVACGPAATDEELDRLGVAALDIVEWPVWPTGADRRKWTERHWSALAQAESEFVERLTGLANLVAAMTAVAFAVLDCHGSVGCVRAVLDVAGLPCWPGDLSPIERRSWSRQHWPARECCYFEWAMERAPGLSERKRRALLRSAWGALLDAEEERFECDGAWWRDERKPVPSEVDVGSILSGPDTAARAHVELYELLQRALVRGNLHLRPKGSDPMTDTRRST
jgi:hypothetical protein